MDERVHEEAKALVAAHVLGAVPPEEAAALGSHILSCEECMAEAESLSHVTSSLALAVAPVRPPEHFAERIMAQVAGQESRGAPVRRAPRRSSLVQVLSFAALLLLVAVLSVTVVNQRNDLARRDAVVSALLRAPGGIRLSGPDGAVAKLVQREQGTLFVAKGLESVAEHRTYQLWFLEGRCAPAQKGPCMPSSAGTFDVSEGFTLFTTDRSFRGYDAAAVTVEPEGGSEQPTTDPVIASL